ncbi:MAG: hypothetical protein K2M27_11050 [Muribaculaceae bacterium]|nr:hypothetical protein [Muribaculaceae bacterium]
MKDRREVFFEKENPNHQFSEEETAELTDFLITNMQMHEGVGGKEYQKFIAYFKAWENSEAKAKAIADSITKIRGDFNPKSLRHIPDWKTIQTDSLWYYVTGLLKLRNDLPWCKKIPWEDFLEHISPYRISNEPLSMGWRQLVLESIKPLTDSLIGMGCDDPLIVAQSIIQYWNRKPFKWTDSFPKGASLGYAGVFLKNGSCQEFAEASVLLMRATGIPSGIDLMLVRGDCNAPHSWPFIKTNDSLTYIATTEKTCWQDPHSLGIPATKVYRYSFSNSELTAKKLFNTLDETDFHPWFRNSHFSDVTSSYFDTYDIEIILDTSLEPDVPVYVCNTMRNMWVPVAIGKVTDGRAVFNDVASSSAACIIARWNGHTMIPVSAPFIIEKSGSVRFMVAGKNLIKSTLFCKYPLSEKNGDVVDRMIGGIIEASDDPGFYNSETLYKITKSPVRKINRVNINSSKPYRYVRYRGADSTYCNIAELEIYSGDNNNIALGKRTFGTPGDRDGDRKHEYTNVFDGNLDTSFDYMLPSGGWSAVDLGKHYKITGVSYSPRNRDNYIREGDKYELFYWDINTNQWKSLGKKIAYADEIIYDIPMGALLFLKNHTQGIDERVFEYNQESGLQVFH